MKKGKKLNNGIFYLVIPLLAVLVFGGLAYGYSITKNQYIENYYEAESPAPIMNEEPILGAFPGTNLMIDELEYGSAISQPLDFSRGASTTPGGMFSILNSGNRKICRMVEVDFEVAGIKPAYFSVGTSTARNAWSEQQYGPTLLASTTVATSTPDTFNSIDDGTDDQYSWEWDRGVYLLGAWDNPKTGDAETTVSNASSSDYSNYVLGKVYVDCHIE
jgi:hypothetical protein